MTYLILNSPDGVHSRKLVQTKEISHGSFPHASEVQSQSKKIGACALQDKTHASLLLADAALQRELYALLLNVRGTSSDAPPPIF